MWGFFILVDAALKVLMYLAMPVTYEQKLERDRASSTKYYHKNREARKAYRRKFYLENKDKCLAAIKECREKYDYTPTAEQKAKYVERNKLWRQRPEVKARIREIERLKRQDPAIREHRRATHQAYRRRRVASDPEFKLNRGLRVRFRSALENNQKAGSAVQLLGISIPEFKDYISAKFTEGMRWDNHGAWHLDHIRPCASFDLSDHEQQRQCFHYSNYQPLWAAENLAKRDKWNPSVLTNPAPESPLSEPQ